MASAQKLRKAIGTIKDSTKVGLANLCSENTALDIAIVKATNHNEFMPNEKYVRRLFYALSATSPRSDVIYCIHGLATRLAKTHTWTVGCIESVTSYTSGAEEGWPYITLGAPFLFSWKRPNAEPDSFQRRRLEELTFHFWCQALDYSAWICKYALYLEERLKCFKILKYDVPSDKPKTRVLDTPNLLKQLPLLQKLLNRLLTCKPVGGGAKNALIHYPLTIVAIESVRLQVTIADGIRKLVDKFFKLQRHDAIKAQEICWRFTDQTEEITKFFQICRTLPYGSNQIFLKIEQLPSSFICMMQDYMKSTLSLRSRELHIASKETDRCKVNVTRETKLMTDHEQDVNAREESETSSNPQKSDQSTPVQIPDLLCMDDITETESEPCDYNPLALEIAQYESSTISVNSLDMADPSNWELSLVSIPSSNVAAVEQQKLVGVFDKLKLDSLYDDAMKKITNQNGNNDNPSITNVYYNEDPFYGSNHETAMGLQISNNTQQQAALTQWQMQLQQQQAFLMQWQMQLQERQDFLMQWQLQLQQQQSLKVSPSLGNPFEEWSVPSNTPQSPVSDPFECWNSTNSNELTWLEYLA
ncbi:hypothetical protein ACFE04_008100 [Oxalis oulophora]